MNKMICLFLLLVLQVSLVYGAGLHNAAEAGNIDTVKDLIEPRDSNNAPAKVDAPDRFGMTPLMLAVSNGHQAVALYLLEQGADPNKRDSFGMTALMWARTSQDPEIARNLLRKGANILAIDNERKTILEHANDNKNIQLMKDIRLWSNARNIKLPDSDLSLLHKNEIISDEEYSQKKTSKPLVMHIGG